MTTQPTKRPAGRSRTTTVIASLVGAIVIGGGLVYGYQQFGGTTGADGKPPVVRGDATAAKARPSDPGGRQFSNTDSKVLGRISSQGRSATGSDGNGTRRVSTVMIGRDGQVVSPGAPPSPAAQAPSEPVVSVPGLTVVDGFGAQRQAARQGAAPLVNGGRPIVVSPPPTTKKTNALSPVREARVTKPPQIPRAAPTPPPVPPKATAPANPAPVAKPKPRAQPPRAPCGSPKAIG